MASNFVHHTSPVLRNKSDLSFNTTAIDRAVMSHAIYDRYDMEWYRKFTRFGIIDPYNTVTTTKEYIFITKPDLCLLDESGNKIHKLLSQYPFFNHAVDRYYQVCRQLQSSVSFNDGPFMTMLSNSVSSSLDIPGISSEMIETAANINGTKISYRGTSLKSDEDHSFTLEFEDTRHLDIYMLFKIWDEYEKLKWNGSLEFNQQDSTRWVNYIINKVLHDQVSIYKLVVDQDGSRLIFWAKLTGCVPVDVPRDAFSDMNNNDEQKLSVGWKAQFVRDMDPSILSHFNLIVRDRANGREELPLYDLQGHHMDGRWSSCPYIEYKAVNDRRGTHYDYFLRWKV